jgi:hypothetical protein
MFSRQNALPFTIFFLLAVTVVCGLIASTGQLSAEASGGKGRADQIPPEFNNPNPEKEFNEDDLKVKEQKKPRGEWNVSISIDKEQFYDDSVPVVVSIVQTLSGQGKYAGVVKIKRLEIKNRSAKAVNSVQLRWKIFNFDDPSNVLLEGATPFVNFWAEADSSKVVEIPTIYPVHLFHPLAKDGELKGHFMLTIGVQEVRFADDSLWRRPESAVLLNLLYYDRPVAERFPSLASIGPIFPSSWVEPGSTPGRFRPCEAKPRSSASAFAFMPLQETTCVDDMDSKIDLYTGAQSCGTPSPGTACISACNGIYCVVYSRGGRCDGSTPTPTPTPTPSPTPECTPTDQQPNRCCKPLYYQPDPNLSGRCVWDCSASDHPECEGRLSTTAALS